MNGYGSGCCWCDVHDCVGDGVCVIESDVVFDGVSGGKGSDKVK